MVLRAGDGADGALRRLLTAGAFANEAQLHGDGDLRSVLGDPTDGALLVAAERAGVDLADLFTRHPPCSVLPFDSARQYMASAPASDGGPAGGQGVEVGDAGLRGHPVIVPAEEEEDGHRQDGRGRREIEP